MSEQVNVNGIGWMDNTVSIEDKQIEVFAKVKHTIANIAESIHRILNTLPGERPGQPEFGCEIRRLLFEPNDFFLQRAVNFYIRKAITDFEPRITIKRMAITPNYNEHMLTVNIWFNVKNNMTKTWVLTSNVSMTS